MTIHRHPSGTAPTWSAPSPPCTALFPFWKQPLPLPEDKPCPSASSSSPAGCQGCRWSSAPAHSCCWQYPARIVPPSRSHHTPVMPVSSRCQAAAEPQPAAQSQRCRYRIPRRSITTLSVPDSTGTYSTLLHDHIADVNNMVINKYKYLIIKPN